MSHYIRIDDPKALEWMQTLIERSISHPGAAAQLAYAHVLAWHQALAAPVKAKEVASIVQDKAAILSEKDLAVVTPKPRKPGRPASKKTQQKKKVIDAKLDYICLAHPKRTGKQAPRDGCEECWFIYKTFNPQAYRAKRAEFERRNTR